jgi:indole-3-glycerol phosphate synthase
MSILDEIFAHKRSEVAAAQWQKPAAGLEADIRMASSPAGFAAAIKRGSHPVPRLIAEIKYRSPSKGVLHSVFAPLDLARAYAQNGAAAISVLTDEKYFGGSLEILQQVSALNLGLPLLRKDFIFDRYQLLEARAAGASAVLLITAMLTPGRLRSLLAAAHTMELEVLVETHTAAEVTQALEAGAHIVGVNNRDLHTFEVCLETCLQLRSQIPAEVVMVAESGIRSVADVEKLAAAGVDAMLVGEGLVTAADVGAKVREFVERT